jgi:hypothetical protein
LVPKVPHEAPILILREHPEVLAELLATQAQVPEHEAIRIEDANFSQTMSAEYRSDLALSLRNRTGQVVLGVLLEVQSAIDADKLWSWPVYATTFRARLRCRVELVVLTPSRSVARWASQPVELAEGWGWAPRVLGPEQIPRVTSVEQARANPELAELSVLVHPEVDVARATIDAAAQLDEERRTLYTDLALFGLDPTTRAELEIAMDLTNYEFKSPLFKGKIEAARAAGTEAGTLRSKAEDVLTVLTARGLAVSDEQRARVLASRDLQMLERWLIRAATRSSMDEVLADG